MEVEVIEAERTLEEGLRAAEMDKQRLRTELRDRDRKILDISEKVGDMRYAHHAN